MKSNFLTIVFILALVTSCQEASESITSLDVEDLMSAWKQSYFDTDTALLANVLHPTFRYSGSSDGSTSSKSEILKRLQSEQLHYIDVVISDLEIDYYDDVAVVRGKENILIGGGEGDTISVKLRFTDVLIKKNGQTRAIATHSSPLD